MDYSFRLTPHAQKELDSLPGSVARRILKKLIAIIDTDNPLASAKMLKGFSVPTYRYRAGDYRVVFRVDARTNAMIILLVIRIAHRKDIYKNLN